VTKVLPIPTWHAGGTSSDIYWTYGRKVKQRRSSTLLQNDVMADIVARPTYFEVRLWAHRTSAANCRLRCVSGPRDIIIWPAWRHSMQAHNVLWRTWTVTSCHVVHNVYCWSELWTQRGCLRYGTYRKRIGYSLKCVRSPPGGVPRNREQLWKNSLEALTTCWTYTAVLLSPAGMRGRGTNGRRTETIRLGNGKMT
jgi:hypothetical protein